MMNDNEINHFDWENRLSVDGVMNIGYVDGVRLMNIMFDPMTMD